MFINPEEFSTATKTGVESHINTMTTLANKAFEGIEKLVDLNLNLVKTSLEESTHTAKQFMSAKDLQEILALSAAQAQPNTQKALFFGRHLANIASNTQLEFSRITEEQILEANRKMIALVDEAAKHAPIGSENAVAFVKSAIGNVNASYEQLAKNTKQTMQTLDANFDAVVNHFAQTAAAK
jgi:phasin family protein